MRSAWVNTIVGVIGVVMSATFNDAMASSRGPALDKAGRVVYQQSCASCHGARGEGSPAWQQPDRQGELPAPPHDSEGHTWKHSDAMLYRIVQQGWRDPFNKTQRLTMPAFQGQLSPRETIAVISYLKTLWTPEQRQFQKRESEHQPLPPMAP